MCHAPLEKTKGVILSGNHPWNRSTFDRLLPRPLLPIAHRPLISYALSWLQQGRLRAVEVCANRETRALQAHLVRHVPKGMSLQYREDPMPRGPAGCVYDSASGSDAKTFVVAEGTAIPTVELEKLLLNHCASGAAVTVVVHTETPQNQKTSLQVPSGIYVFERRAIDLIPRHGFFDIKENLIPLLSRSGENVAIYSVAGASPRVLDALTYLAVNGWMVDQLAQVRERRDGYAEYGHLVHNRALIAEDAVLVGPVLIGPGVRVMSGATIVGPTSIGADAIVERGSLVARSAVWRRSVVGQEAVVDRCILADDAVVDPKTQLFGAVKAGNRERWSEWIRAARIPLGFPDLLPGALDRGPGRVLSARGFGSRGATS